MSTSPATKHGFLTADGVYYMADKPISDGDTVIPLRPGDSYFWDKDKEKWIQERRSVERVSRREEESVPFHQSQLGPTPSPFVSPETKFQLTLQQLFGMLAAVALFSGSVYLFDNRVTRLEERVKEVESKQSDVAKELKSLSVQMRDLEDTVIRTIRQAQDNGKGSVQPSPERR